MSVLFGKIDMASHRSAEVAECHLYVSRLEPAWLPLRLISCRAHHPLSRKPITTYQALVILQPLPQLARPRLFLIRRERHPPLLLFERYSLTNAVLGAML